jgi:hypothetical protein
MWILIAIIIIEWGGGLIKVDVFMKGGQRKLDKSRSWGGGGD